MPSGNDPMGGNRFSEKIMLKQKNRIMIRCNRIMREMIDGGPQGPP